MALHKMGKRPPSPEAGNYIWVDTKEGGFWRRKRGSNSVAKLNAAFQQSNEHTKICSPAASRIVKKLRPYMNGLQPGRIVARICGKLRKSMNETGSLDLRCLLGLDFQPGHPIERLLQGDVFTEQTTNEIIVWIPIGEHTIKRLNGLVTNYYFEFVLLYGDAGKEGGLRTESEDSSVYDIGQKSKDDCRLSIVVPEQPWIALLKVNCIEGNELAASSKLYGMKVVGVSGE